MNEFLKKLRRMPYETRLRILWATTAVIAILLFIIFQPFFRMDKIISGLSENQLVETIKEGAKDAQEGLTDLKSELTRRSTMLADLPEDYRAVILKGLSIKSRDKKLLVNFEAQNPTSDILDLLNAERGNITLSDGETVLQPLAITTLAAEPFPLKILSKKTLSGQIVFPLPENSAVTVSFAGLFFESQADIKFNETLALDLTTAIPVAEDAEPRE